MAVPTDTEAWSQGGEKHRGQRLLPHVIDYYAHHDPHRVYAAISESETMVGGFQDVDMKTMATAVDHMAWWLRETFKNVKPRRRTLAYMGTSDLRYTIMLMAAIKCGWRTMYIAPQNPVILNLGLLQQADVYAILYADVLQSVARSLQKFDPAMSCTQVPTMADLLKSQAQPYPFNVSFVDIKDEKCLILHTSGTRGPPKLVYLTHAALSCVDNDPKVPVPEGRRLQNATQFHFKPPGRFYSWFPPYHIAGVESYTLLPTFSQTATVVMGPSMMMPDDILVNTVINEQDIRALYLSASVIEQWLSEPSAYQQAENLDFVMYRGGHLAREVGHRLSEVTSVCQMYGSLEMGQIQLLVPRPEDWEYLELNPAEQYDMQPVDDGVYEMVLNCEYGPLDMRFLQHIAPHAKEWRTKDLFVPHPNKPGLWRFHSHIDDIIVLSSKDRVWPVPMENVLASNPNVAGALMVGNGRPEVLLLVEPRRGPQVDRMSKKEYIELIWPTISEANALAPENGKIRRSRVLLSQPNLGLFRTVKGTIAREPTESLYAEHIAAAFINGTTDEESEIGILEKHWLDDAKRFIASIIHDIRPEIVLKETDDFFVTKAMDSLAAVELGQKLRRGLMRRMDAEHNTIHFWLRAIFENPSIDSLARATLDAVFGTEDSRSDPQSYNYVEDLLNELTSHLPEPSNQEPRLSLPTEGLRVVLIGTRDRLGAYIMKDLLEDPRIAGIKCLDRGDNGQAAFQSQAFKLGLDVAANDSRLQFVSIDLSKPNLDLSEEHLDGIYNGADIIIHNLWTENFALSLTSFKDEWLKSVSTVIEIANRAPSQPRIVFISTTAAAGNWSKAISANVPVPEEVINCAAVATPMGYAQSKHVAERLLAAAGAQLRIPISILRLGQVVGPRTSPEKWILDSRDWMHSLAVLSKASGLIPYYVGSVDWIPVNDASRIVQDLSLKETHDTDNLLQLFNIVHPQPVPFSELAIALQNCISSSRQVSFEEWVQYLTGLPPNTLSRDAEVERARILPWFQRIVGRALPQFVVDKTKAASATMAQIEPIDRELIGAWCRQWTAS